MNMFPRFRTLIIPCLLFLPFAACFDQCWAQDGAEKPPTIEERVKSLEDQWLSAMLKMSNAVIAATTNKATDQTSLPTSLDCDSQTFAQVQARDSLLVFFVVCDTVEPYLEGHKVKVKIGNPYAVDFVGFSGVLRHGNDILEALAQQSRVPFSSPQALRAGRWNSYTVVVNPSKPSQMKSIMLDLSVDVASLLAAQ